MTSFLHLFSAHRAALAQAQRAEDLLIYERTRADNAEAALHAAQQDAITRERQLLDRAMTQPVKQSYIATPEDHAEQLKMVGTPVRKWQADKSGETMKALEKMAQQIREQKAQGLAAEIVEGWGTN